MEYIPTCVGKYTSPMDSMGHIKIKTHLQNHYLTLVFLAQPQEDYHKKDKGPILSGWRSGCFMVVGPENGGYCLEGHPERYSLRHAFIPREEVFGLWISKLYLKVLVSRYLVV